MTTTSSSSTDYEPFRFRFSQSGQPATVMGRPIQQVAPVVVGGIFAVVMMMAGQILTGLIGPVLGLAVALGRWKDTPIYEMAAPGTRLWLKRRTGRDTWIRRNLTATTNNDDGEELPAALAGLELVEAAATWLPHQPCYGVVLDRPAGRISATVPVAGSGFPVAARREQDRLIAAWGEVLAPLADVERSAVCQLVWQDWSRPEGVAAHESFLDEVAGADPATAAGADYRDLLARSGPVTVAHEITLTLTVDIARVKAHRGATQLDTAVDLLGQQLGALATRAVGAGVTCGDPLAPAQIAEAVRFRSDPTRTAAGTVTSLASALGVEAVEWGPMATRTDWSDIRVDGSWHRSFKVNRWPTRPVHASWLEPLLVGCGAATRTVTVVMEPVPASKAAAEANRQLTTLGAEGDAKTKAGFRETARERRRSSEVEDRENELAAGFAMVVFAAVVTVTAGSAEALDDAAAQVTRAGVQSQLDLRPLTAQQEAGWVASLPLGRAVRKGLLS